MSFKRWFLKFGTLSVAALAVSLGVYSSAAQSGGEEPIAFIGHGAFFDATGKQISPSAEFLQKSERWYEERLLTSPDRIREFKATHRKLTLGLELGAAEQLFARQAALAWVAKNAPSDPVDSRTLGKLHALQYSMRRSLVQKGLKTLFNSFQSAPISVELIRRVDRLSSTGTFSSKAGIKLNAIDNGMVSTPGGGKAYVDECAAAGVPIPPPIGDLDPAGLKGWKSQGFLDPAAQFIVGTPAEIRTYENPQGVCYALPRYEDDTKQTVSLDGVICFSKTTAKACFWDNQMNGKGFSFPNGTRIPIGYADPAINADLWYQAGGPELEGGTGGVCTECHAGENPFIVHPKADLGNGVAWGTIEDSLPAFGPDRYVPLVPASWPQNTASAPDSLVPPACGGCHGAGDAGRLPALSPALQGYCSTILPQALDRTMPPRNPGSQANGPGVQAFLALCTGG